MHRRKRTKKLCVSVEETLLRKIIKEMNKMATKFEELQVKVTELTDALGEVATSITDLAADSQAAFDALQAKIDAGGTGPDLTPLIDQMGTNVAKLVTISDAIKALDDKAEGISGVETPPSA